MSIQKLVNASFVGAFLVFVHLFFSVNAFTQTRTLKEVMGQMGRNFEQISRAIQQGTLGQAEVETTRTIHTLALEAATIVPDFVQTVPEDQRPALILRYEKSMTDLAHALVELETAISLGDLAQVRKAFAKVLQIRNQGHSAFRPPVRP